MSVQASAWVWNNSRAEGGTLLVALALANRADEEGVCWPGVKRLSEWTRMSERSVQRHLRTLEELGELEVTPRFGDSSVYRLLIEGVSDCHPRQNGFSPVRVLSPNTKETFNPSSTSSSIKTKTRSAVVENRRMEKREKVS